jgi:anti-anti-sigma regulatory factor
MCEPASGPAALRTERSVSVVIDQDSESSLIRLEDAIDISCAAELKEATTTAIQAGKPVQILLEGATCLDVTAMQILWAAERAARAQGLGFTLKGQLPEALAAILRNAGWEGFPLPERLAERPI